MTAEIEISDTITVTGITIEDLVAECALRLSLRDSSKSHIPDFEGPTRRIETEKVLENYVEIEELDSGNKSYTTEAIFDDSGEGFNVMFTLLESSEDGELEIRVTSYWSVNYHERDSFMGDLKMIKRTQDALLESMRDVVGAYHFEADGVSTVFDEPQGSQFSNSSTR